MMTTAHSELSALGVSKALSKSRLVGETSTTSRGISQVDGVTTTLPTAADPRVRSHYDSGDITIRPSDSRLIEAKNGVAHLRSQSATEFVVHATSDGSTQIIAISRTAKDAAQVKYDVSTPVGTRWKKLADGSLALMGADTAGAPIATIARPWAVDANGKVLPSSFRVVGTQIVQVTDVRGAILPVTSDPRSGWWWAANIAKCAYGLATLVVVGAKLVSVFAKAERIIKASMTLIKAYKALGNNAKKFVNILIKYFKAKGKVNKSLTKAQVAAVNTILKNMGNTLMALLGVDGCLALYREIRTG